eukprot:CAMPEP_0168556542 /NCGR_PEP_ID=MMETSP0413-20121227/8939_1 /TAXON_ID=136452 /ORGANISM="Filamoeba nolandi, Strain NC-AS-23-1" /LENGTH=553 /DNA_ID=CAMNT_0008587497 /DNA_START=38 /DNA_END=1699 /DNA_ORIENTATION=+
MAYPPPQSSVPLSKVELSFSCSKLKNLDITSKSDPQLYVFLQPPRTTTWTEIGKTEQIQDNLNPKFAQSVVVDYYFEEVQNMKFVVVDVDKPGRGWQEQDYIGALEITLGGIVGSRGSQVTKELLDKHKKPAGFVTISAEEVQEMRMSASFRLSAHGLEKKDFFGKSDPFLVISKIRIEDNQFVKVHQTEYILKTLDPVWKPFQIPITKLCNGDLDRPLLIECFDWNKSGSFELIGHVQTSVKELQTKKGHTLDLVDPKKKGKKGYNNSGTLRIDDLELIKEHTFLDYIVGGCKISLMVAIDFTGSNGDPRKPESLHFINPYSPNEYEKAIMAVGNILACYDSDNMFPVYGFGAKVPPSYQVSHCFALNGNPSNPEVFGVQGILDVYHKAITECQLYGPTNFQTIINMAGLIAAPHQSQQDQQYLILLIITDGEITDMDQTVEEIIKTSKLPLSIIIVGVGGADFTKMNILDADNQALSYGGKTAERDIVQFVPFRDYQNVHYSKLAADTLAEVPGQLVGWMKRRNIVPNPPLQYAPPPQQQPVMNQNPAPLM